MTIIYQYRVATTSLGGFLKLLLAWKGSVYKVLYKELIIFLSLYAAISLVYRLALTPDQQRAFEGIVTELNNVSSAIPLSFVLGFYVTFIVQRWWQQFTNVPWPDRTLFLMTTYLHGFDDKARMMRRAVARYMLFGLIFIMRAVSVAVMKRFPTLDHIVEAGFITKEEAAIFEGTQCQYQKFWVPLMWANNILVTARREGKIESDFGLRMIIQQLADFRDKCSLCFVYDWITVPLVYTQVVTFAVFSYFAVCLFGQQYLDPTQGHKGFEADFYVPGFTILQFLFYMGWLKVAEQMINPFGEDDDDYDINWLLDRHTAVAFALVDQCYGKHPGLTKDQFWNDVAPDVPYTESSARSMRPNFLGSTFNIGRPSTDTDRLLVLRDHDDVNQHAWSTRPRGKGSMTESLLTLFPFRHLRHHGNADSSLTLESSGSGHGRLMSVPNGKAYYRMISKGDDNNEDGMRRSSVDLPVTTDEDDEENEDFQLRERASTDSDFRYIEDKERKLSLPFFIPLFGKTKQKKLDTQQPPGSPKVSRFTVETVREATPIDGEGGSSGKARRSGHANINIDKVSRVPVLSAIEEGNTVTSIKQMMYPHVVDQIPEDDGDENEDDIVFMDDDGDDHEGGHVGKDTGDDEDSERRRSRPDAPKSVTFEDTVITHHTEMANNNNNNVDEDGKSVTVIPLSSSPSSSPTKDSSMASVSSTTATSTSVPDATATTDAASVTLSLPTTTTAATSLSDDDVPSKPRKSAATTTAASPIAVTELSKANMNTGDPTATTRIDAKAAAAALATTTTVAEVISPHEDSITTPLLPLSKKEGIRQ